MKKILFTVSFAMMMFAGFAQSKNAAGKFVQFYKVNQTDSIYLLFNAKMKAALQPDRTKALINQIKEQLGDIVRVKEGAADANGVSEFRLSFERPVVDLSLFISKDSIAGIVQKAVQAEKPDNNSPDNFSFNNQYGALYGTLTLPEGKQKVPVVLMIGGSGPTDRNMNQGQSLKTNSFLILAKALAEKGIASIRYDKEGVGKSTAAINPAGPTFDDFIKDAKLLYDKLSSDSRFSKVIILGHSEGAAIGLIASLAVKPAGFISVCGYDSDILTLLDKQLKPQLTVQDYAVFNKISDSLKAGKVMHSELPAALSSIFSITAQNFLISARKYNSGREIQKLNVPILLIGGSTDLQVTPEAAVKLSRMNKNAGLKVIQEMNHVLKRAPLDRMSNLATYNNPDLPIHEDLIPALLTFIQKVQLQH